MNSLIKEIQELYNLNFYSAFKGRYLSLKDLSMFIEANQLSFEIIGQSLFNNPIYKTSIGKGKIKVLIWAQMHGNETTGTKAILDSLLMLKTDSKLLKTVLDKLQIDFIPILNPDAAEIYSRIHPSGIDMNRDFLAKSLPETNLLVDLVNKNEYSVLFNLHDQRTIFGASNDNPATLSFLAPSENIEREVTENKKKSMGIINFMNTNLQMLINGNIGRYTDEFYPTASGDNFSKMGFPCVLFEAGHFPNDYNREITRKYNTIAIILGLYFVATEKDLTTNYEGYFTIPENKSNFLDVIFRNVNLKDAIHPIDIGIQFVEQLDKETNQINFEAKILEIGDLRNKVGHTEYNSDKRIFKSISGEYLSIGNDADFLLGDDWIIKNGKLLN